MPSAKEFEQWLKRLELALATGKVNTDYSAVDDARARALARFDARVAGTPLAPLLAHVPRYRGFRDLGQSAGVCAVTGLESQRLRTVRFDAAVDAPATMTCEITTDVLKALRCYYALYYWTEITIAQIWRGELADHHAKLEWILANLEHLGVFVAR